MSPLALEILLKAYYGSQEPHPSNGTVPYREAVDAFVAAGMIELGEYGYRTTERGAAHVHQLLALPFPMQGWIGADGRLIATHGAKVTM